MNKKELLKKVNKVYRDYDAGEYDSGDALLDVIDLVKEYATEDDKTLVGRVDDLFPNVYAQYLIEEMNIALLEFGTYSFDDKGPHEVMTISKYVAELREKTVEEIAKVLTKVLDIGEETKNYRCETLVNALVGDMDTMNDADWDKLFTLDNRFEY